MEEQIQHFLCQPFPLWENHLTKLLVDQHWLRLNAKGLAGPSHYRTDWFLGEKKISAQMDVPRVAILDENGISLEFSSQHLQGFYEDHGLEPLSEAEILQSGAKDKLREALLMLDKVEGVLICIGQLVQSIQVLRQNDPEIDVSYSHPDIPFTIFVSVCEDQSAISSLRVAESILHEAMHLKLTLIEGVVPLIKPSASGRFFSPWRDELRPARGVLHGMFVFRGILEFYAGLLDTGTDQAIEYVQYRIRQIQSELNQLSSFKACIDLTNQGMQLTRNLLLVN